MCCASLINESMFITLKLESYELLWFITISKSSLYYTRSLSIIVVVLNNYSSVTNGERSKVMSIYKPLYFFYWIYVNIYNFCISFIVFNIKSFILWNWVFSILKRLLYYLMELGFFHLKKETFILGHRKHISIQQCPYTQLGWTSTM